MSWEAEVTMMDVVVDGGTASFDEKTKQFTILLGPALSHYSRLETKFERILYRGLLEGFGIMRPRSEQP